MQIEETEAGVTDRSLCVFRDVEVLALEGFFGGWVGVVGRVEMEIGDGDSEASGGGAGEAEEGDYERREEEEGQAAEIFPNPGSQALGFNSYSIAIYKTAKRKKITDTANAFFFFQNQKEKLFSGGGEEGGDTVS